MFERERDRIGSGERIAHVVKPASVEMSLVSERPENL